MVNPTTMSMKKYGAVGKFSANTALKISEYKDLFLDVTSAPYFQKDANSTTLIGRVGMISGNRFITKTTAKQCPLPIGIIMAPDEFNYCELPTHNVGDWTPANKVVMESGKGVIASYPIAVRGVVAIYMKDATTYKAGDIVCFKNEELGKTGGEVKIASVDATTGDFTIPEGYLATSARVWDTQTFGKKTEQKDILWIQINDNQAPAPVKPTEAS